MLPKVTANPHLPKVNGDISWFRNESLSTAKSYCLNSQHYDKFGSL
jgi:hypothetical protein